MFLLLLIYLIKAILAGYKLHFTYLKCTKKFTCFYVLRSELSGHQLLCFVSCDLDHFPGVSTSSHKQLPVCKFVRPAKLVAKSLTGGSNSFSDR